MLVRQLRARPTLVVSLCRSRLVIGSTGAGKSPGIERTSFVVSFMIFSDTSLCELVFVAGKAKPFGLFPNTNETRLSLEYQLSRDKADRYQ